MKCDCGAEARRVVFRGGKNICPSCSDISESGGNKMRGTLTRMRVRGDSYKYEGDMIPPYKYDKHSRKVKVDDDFKKKYPKQSKMYEEE